MTLRPIRLRSGAPAALLALVVLAAPAARAFTVVDPDTGGQVGAVPKFDLEEQTRQFRSGTTAAPGAAIREFQTPLGKGTVHFGVQHNAPSFGSPFSFGPNGFRVQEDRRHMDRMLAPPGLQHQYDR